LDGKGSDLVIRRSRKKGDAVVTLAITAGIILLVIYLISLLVTTR
jgi:hypothetical protein